MNSVYIVRNTNTYNWRERKELTNVIAKNKAYTTIRLTRAYKPNIKLLCIMDGHCANGKDTYFSCFSIVLL